MRIIDAIFGKAPEPQLTEVHMTALKTLPANGALHEFDARAVSEGFVDIFRTLSKGGLVTLSRRGDMYAARITPKGAQAAKAAKRA